jgi:hypothetical protein
VTLPFIALYTGLQAALGNLFIVEWYEAAVVTALAVIMGDALMITTEIRLRTAANKELSPEIRAQSARMAVSVHRTRTRVVAIVLAALPLTIAMCCKSEGSVLAGVILGFASALILLVLVSIAYHLFLDPRAQSSGLALRIPYADSLKRIQPPHVALTRPVMNHFGAFAHEGHLFALVSALVYFGIYLWIGGKFAPYGPHGDWFPALGYIVLLITIGAWVLPGLAYWLDGWHVPPVLAVMIVSFGGYWIFGTDHYYETYDAKPQGGGADAASPSTVVQNWFQAHANKTNPKMVVVAASGGGITAAAWTADVLTALEGQQGDQFTNSLTLISSTSGGSVGSMYYLDHFQRAKPPSSSETDLNSETCITEEPRRAPTGKGTTSCRVRQAANASSLRQVAWGFVYPDLWRFLFPPLVDFKTRWGDRGWGIEYAWRRWLGDDDKDGLLGDWRPDVASGELPVPLFNATVVDTGELLMLTPIDLTGAAAFGGFRQFYTLYSDKDIRVLTAVRLSATFPYVTPVARPTDPGKTRDGRDGPNYHIADGGYEDNFGMEAVTAWLDTALLTYRKQGGSDVLVIQIRAFAPPEDEKSMKQPHGWWYEVLGPVMTLLNVRTPAQQTHNRAQLVAVRSKWEVQGVRFWDAEFVLSPPKNTECYQPPLSWQLSRAEKLCIASALKESENQTAMRHATDFFAAQPKPASKPQG